MIYYLIFQYPFLSDPTLSIIPFSFKEVRILYTLLLEKPVCSDNFFLILCYSP